MENSEYFLTKSGRRNLEAICEEFVRCSRMYPALFHQRLKPWSEEGEMPITMDQWEAFKRVEHRSEGGSWSQWDGPIAYLGGSDKAREFRMWHGQPDGLQEFTSLAESLEMVVRSEDIAADNFPHSLTAEFWPFLLHEWAFRYQMPLLRSEISLWGLEDDSYEEFYELAEQWSSDEATGQKYPRHPIVWDLTFSVFTSSIAALRAILEPDAVHSSNDVWLPDFISESVQPSDELACSPETDLDANTNCHRLLFNGIHWQTVTVDGKKLPPLRQSSGMQRIAAMLSNPDYRFPPPELQQSGARPIKRHGITAEYSAGERGTDASEFLSHRTSIDTFQDVTDIEACKDIRKQIEILAGEHAEAERSEDGSALQEIESRINELKRQLVFDNDKSGAIRIFHQPAWEKSRKTTANTIRTAFEDLRNLSESLADELDSQIVREKGFTYRPNSDLPRWVVSVPETSSQS